MLNGAGEEGVLRNGGGVDLRCGRILDGHQLGGLLLVAAGISGEERAGHLPCLRAGSLNTVHGKEHDGDRSAAIVEGRRQIRGQGRITLDGHRSWNEIEFRCACVDEGHRLARIADIATGVRRFEVTGDGVLTGTGAGQGVRIQLDDIGCRVAGIGIGRQIDREGCTAFQGHRIESKHEDRSHGVHHMDQLARLGRVAAGVRREEGQGDFPGLGAIALDAVHGKELDHHGAAAGVLRRRKVRWKVFVAEDGRLGQHVHHRGDGVDDLNVLLGLSRIAAIIGRRERPDEGERTRTIDEQRVHCLRQGHLATRVEGGDRMVGQILTAGQDDVSREVVHRGGLRG